MAADPAAHPDTETRLVPDRSAPHRAFARVMILLTAAVALVMLATVAIPWLTQIEPTSFIEVVGDPSHENCEMAVEGYGLSKPLYATLSKQNGYRVRFFLDEGSYSVRLRAPDGKGELGSTTLALAPRQWVLLDITRDLKVPATNRAPAPASKATNPK